MSRTSTPTEPTVQGRVFETWSIEIPATFEETFVREDDYWHAFDERRSVSLTSVVITERGDPVSAERILRQLGPLEGAPLDQRPPGVAGLAATAAAPQPARASRVLCGLLAIDGRVLVVSITSDDTDWALRVWLSIRSHPSSASSSTKRANSLTARPRTH